MSLTPLSISDHAMLARAKLNLCLHVVGQRADGYHLLESLVVFPEIGDRLEVAPGPGLGLTLDGPFALELGGGDDNLVIRAALALDAYARAKGDGQRREASLRLSKQLPIASGIGGGSADAAAALKLLCAFWALTPSDADLAEIALGLGADVPVCLSDRPVWMRGVGEQIAPAAALPTFWLVLANPGVAVSTPDVFRALAVKANPPVEATGALATVDALVDWLATTRNDLQPPAIALQPVIGTTLSALQDASGCRLARMSGSGATCFGVFAEAEAALDAAGAMRSAYPDWWIAAAPVTGEPA